MEKFGKIVDGWFYEKNSFFHGQTQAINVKELLYEGKSKYQDILCFNSDLHGTVLVLDGAVQCTTFDEFAYQEMISFLPVNCHPCPKKVLVIGGGDGGVSRELDKHPLVEKIILCELDEEVINVSKKYLPKMAEGFNSKKLTLHIQDGYQFLADNKNSFDIIICDLSDPDGPAEMLFTKNAFQLMFDALNDDGIACLQAESLWLMAPLIKKWMDDARELFPVVSYSCIYIPSYPGGHIGFILLSKNKYTKFDKPLHSMDPVKFNLQYYSDKIHSASFILPYKFEKMLL